MQTNLHMIRDADDKREDADKRDILGHKLQWGLAMKLLSQCFDFFFFVNMTTALNLSNY